MRSVPQFVRQGRRGFPGRELPEECVGQDHVPARGPSTQIDVDRLLALAVVIDHEVQFNTSGPGDLPKLLAERLFTQRPELLPDVHGPVAEGLGHELEDGKDQQGADDPPTFPGEVDHAEHDHTDGDEEHERQSEPRGAECQPVQEGHIGESVGAVVEVAGDPEREADQTRTEMETGEEEADPKPSPLAAPKLRPDCAGDPGDGRHQEPQHDRGPRRGEGGCKRASEGFRSEVVLSRVAGRDVTWNLAARGVGRS